jgi:hypothetical protein
MIEKLIISSLFLLSLNAYSGVGESAVITLSFRTVHDHVAWGRLVLRLPMMMEIKLVCYNAWKIQKIRFDLVGGMKN